MTAPVIGITGHKDAGKTTLVTHLVAELTGRGYRVSTVKHAHHSAEVDRPGTDSHSHRLAGAGEVALVTPKRYAIMGELRGAREPSLDAVLARLAPADLVIVEGYKREPIGKIEVRRSGARSEPPMPAIAGVVAIASDVDIPDAPVPVLPLDEVAAVADFIVSHLGLEPANASAVG